MKKNCKILVLIGFMLLPFIVGGQTDVRQRPVKINREDELTIRNLEKIFQYYDDVLRGIQSGADVVVRNYGRGPVSASSGGGSTTAGYLLTTEDLNSTSEGVAASLTCEVSFITSNDDGDQDSVSVADGTKGQRKIFIYVDQGIGDNVIVVPVNANFGGGNTYIDFDQESESCILIFNGTDWNIVAMHPTATLN